MNTLTTPTQANTVSDDDLLMQVFSILDSKIQYLKFAIKEAVKDYVDTDKVKKLPPETATTILQDSDEVWQRNSLMFELVERYNRSLRLMLFVRQRLATYNSKLVLLLMQNEAYLNYSEEHLSAILQKPMNTNPPSSSSLNGAGHTVRAASSAR